jgi:hypothetical protein
MLTFSMPANKAINLDLTRLIQIKKAGINGTLAKGAILCHHR